MKSSFKTLALFVLLCVGLNMTLTAQEQYTIKMSMKMDGLPPEYAAMGEQEITTYIREKQQKSEITGMLGNTQVYYDGKNMTTLMDQMGTKRGFTATKEELEADEKSRGTSKPTIEYINETKQIAGYDCKKAILTTVDKDKNAMKTTVWYTDKIKVNTTQSGRTTGGMVELGDLKGYPLSMELSQMAQGKEMKSTITANEVLTTPIDDAVFRINTEGYTMMGYKEMKEIQNAGMLGK